MAFKLNDIIIDRIQMGYAEDFQGNPLYTLTQLSEATIETTAESKDATDKDGTLIKRFYQAKAGTFTATNAMLNLSVIEASGATKKVGAEGEDNMVVVPKIEVVKGGTATVELSGILVNEKGVRDEDGLSVKVNALGNNGALGQEFTITTDEASDTEFKIVGNTLTLPTADVDNFVIRYNRKEVNAVEVVNKADKFPGTIRLILKCLAVDPCSADTLRSCYVILHSFQVSPELSISLTTEGTLDYSGDLQVDYCSADKKLYTIVMCEADEEDEE